MRISDWSADVCSSDLPYPEAKKLARFFLIQKRIGQLGEGNKAWLRLVTKEGKIHGRYNTNGAVTGRATHYDPNKAQVPSVGVERSEEHTSELQSLMRISYAVFCLKKKKRTNKSVHNTKTKNRVKVQK